MRRTRIQLAILFSTLFIIVAFMSIYLSKNGFKSKKVDNGGYELFYVKNVRKESLHYVYSEYGRNWHTDTTRFYLALEGVYVDLDTTIVIEATTHEIMSLKGVFDYGVPINIKLK